MLFQELYGAGLKYFLLVILPIASALRCSSSRLLYFDVGHVDNILRNSETLSSPINSGPVLSQC